MKSQATYGLTYEFEYDEKSFEFKTSLKSYQTHINVNGNTQEMFDHIAFNINNFGYNTEIEGVGFVGYFGIIPYKEPYSGIMVIDEY